MSQKNSLKEKLIREIEKLPEDRFDSIYQILHCLKIAFTKKERPQKKLFLTDSSALSAIGRINDLLNRLWI